MTVRTSFRLMVLAAVFILLVSIGYLGLKQAGMTGKTIAEAGNVTRLDLEMPYAHSYWQGIYGNIANIHESDSLYINGSETGIIRLDVGLMKCYYTELYATTLTEIDWNSVVPANPSDIDSYLGLSSTNIMSGTAMFTQQKVFNIYSQDIGLFYTTTNAATGEYDLGILKQDNTLIFVTSIVDDSRSFNNESADYQMMLAVPAGTGITYNFFLDAADSGLCGLNNQYPEFVEPPETITVSEDEPLVITLEGTDPDGDLVSFSSSHPFEITYIDAYNANLTWTPENDYSGYNNITFSIEDIYGHETNFSTTVFVTPANDPPEITSAYDIRTYLHEQVISYVFASDIDNLNMYAGDDNILEFDTLQHYSWLNIETRYNASSNSYYGLINFTPLVSHEGVWDIGYVVTDGITTHSRNITLSVGYCGNLDEADEPLCESDYEDCGSCPNDCGECSADTDMHMTIDIDYRNCVGKDNTARILNLVDRGECEQEGKIVNGREVCGIVSDADIELYLLKDKEWQLVDEYVSDEYGMVNFVGDETGSYKLVAGRRGYHTTYAYFEIGKCTELITEGNVQESEIEEIDKPSGTKPEIEQPSEIDAEKPGSLPSFKRLAIYYSAIMMISAILINFGYKYYLLHRETNVFLVRTRSFFVQKILPGLKKAKYHILDFLGF